MSRKRGMAEVTTIQQFEFEESNSKISDQKLTPAEKLNQGYRFTSLSEEEKEELALGLVEGIYTFYKPPPPPENPLFQLFSVSVEFKNAADKPKQGKLYGYIQVFFPDDYVTLYDCEPDEYEYYQPISNNGLVSLVDPYPPSSVSAAHTLKINAILSVHIEDRVLKVCDNQLLWDHASRNDRNCFDLCRSRNLETDEGSTTLCYMFLKRAVQATMEVMFNGVEAVRVFGNIVAYYGDFVYSCNPDEKVFYKLTLFEANSDDDPVLLETGEMPLLRAMLGVPGDSSLIIEAHLSDSLGVQILDGIYKFPVKFKDSTTICIEERGGFPFQFKVDWECKAAT